MLCQCALHISINFFMSVQVPKTESVFFSPMHTKDAMCCCVLRVGAYIWCVCMHTEVPSENRSFFFFRVITNIFYFIFIIPITMIQYIYERFIFNTCTQQMAISSFLQAFFLELSSGTELNNRLIFVTFCVIIAVHSSFSQYYLITMQLYAMQLYLITPCIIITLINT